MTEEIKSKLHTLLRKSEKYTKTDMVYLASGGFWLTVKKVLSAGIALSLSVAFANLLPQEVFGEYKFVFSIFALLTIPTLLGMGKSVTKSVAQGYEGTPIQAVKVRMLWGALGSLASVFVALYYFTNGNLGLAGAFGLVAIFIPFIETFGLFNSVLTGKQLFKVSILYETVLQTAAAIVITFTLFFTDTLFIILLNYFLVHTASRFIAFQMVMKLHTDNKKVDYSAISYGKHMSVMSIIGKISEALDTILLWHFVGAVPLALYSFAKAIPVQIRFILGSIPTLAFPKFAKSDYESVKKPLVRKMLKMFLFMIIVVGLYYLAAPYIYRILFPQYTEAIFYSQIFALSLLFFPQKFIGILFQAHAHTKALYISTTVAPIIKLVLAIILIPSFGIMGAIYTELGARAFNLLILSFLFVRTRL